MDFINLLIPKERIVGIEIGEQKLRMIYLEFDSFGHASVKGKSEVDLPEGSGAWKTDGGKILSESLARLKQNFKPKKFFSPFAIVTISQVGVYGDIMDIPKNMDGEQALEAISLNAAVSMPFALAECYLDWQIVSKGETINKVLVSAIKKKNADIYIKVLKENGFKLIALEPASLSIARVANISDEPVIFFYLTDGGLTGIIYYQKNLYYGQFECWKDASGGKEIKRSADLNKILNKKSANFIRYFENQYHPMKIKKIFLMSEGFDADKIIKSINFTDLPVVKAESNITSLKNYDWIPAAGAARRAFVPRREDTIISLLPVGTESLYEEEKAASFAKSVMLLATALAFFYSIVLVAVFSFFSFVESSAINRLEARSVAAIPAEYVKLESDTREFNSYVRDLALFYPETSVDYGQILENLGKLSGAGINMNNVNFGGDGKAISVSGVALSRENLNVFKFQAENSPYFKEVKFSIQNIAQKNNIPFSLTLYSK